jgi:hypothetical protein
LFYLLSECVLSACVKMSGIRITPPSALSPRSRSRSRESFLSAALRRLPSGRAGIESIVAQCDSGEMDDYMGARILISLLEDLGLLYRMRIVPRLVGFDPDFWFLQRCDESDVMELLMYIASVGWDEIAHGHAICIENDPPFAGFFETSSVFGALTCGKVNSVLRFIAAGFGPCSDPMLALDGFLNLEHIRQGFDPRLAQAAQQGLQWTVIHHSARHQYPDALRIMQDAWCGGGGGLENIRAHHEATRRRMALPLQPVEPVERVGPQNTVQFNQFPFPVSLAASSASAPGDGAHQNTVGSVSSAASSVSAPGDDDDYDSASAPGDGAHQNTVQPFPAEAAAAAAVGGGAVVDFV